MGSPAKSRHSTATLSAHAPTAAGGSARLVAMRILATSVFERVVYHCHLLDAHEPNRPVLEVDAILRDGDADGPLLVTIADIKRMIGLGPATTLAARWRADGRTEMRDGVEYLIFPIWQTTSTA